MNENGELFELKKPWIKKINRYPHAPGVYFFKDNNDIFLYVGKAKDLRKRLSSYAVRVPPDIKTRTMLSQANDVDFIVTSSEKEALLLEVTLIKRHLPKYNVILRDDKNYPALRLNLSQSFPRLEIVRKIKNDGAVYFGPFPSAKSVRQTLKMVNKVFPIRQCRSKKLQKKARPCLNFQIGRCLGPCARDVKKKEYDKIVREVILFLQGKTDQLQRTLRKQMKEAADELNFEKAAILRDRLEDVENTLERQKIISTRFQDKDVIAIYREKETAGLSALFIRKGILIDSRNFFFQKPWASNKEIIGAFLIQFYRQDKFIPQEILVSHMPEGSDSIAEFLSELRGRRVMVRKPSRGEGRQLIQLATENAKKHLDLKRSAKISYETVALQLQSVLSLSRAPSYIACVDISHFQGSDQVGAFIVFANGTPWKKGYRKFRIHLEKKADDPAMVAEVIQRYFSETKDNIRVDLDLLVIDGGKAQLMSAQKILKNLGRNDIQIIGFAKARGEKHLHKSNETIERIYTLERKKPILLYSKPAAYLFLQQVRDEAHRFAITYHQKKYLHRILTSRLDEIPGVGPRRRNNLLQHFKNIDEIKKATREDLLQVDTITRTVARNIYKFFHPETEEDII